MPAGSNNPFGIKARNGDPFVPARTHEVMQGQTVVIVDRFRKFDSIAEAFDAHGALLATAKVYAKAMEHKDDPNAFADALTGRYATDPNYGTSLKRLMAQQKLYQYDSKGPAPDFDFSFDSDVAATPGPDSLSTGSKGVRVKALQQQLVDLNYTLGQVDGVFGPLTRAALAAFQVDNGLVGTGMTDAATWAALDKGQPRPLDPQRASAKPADVAAKGSVVINQADNVKLAGLISSILGAFGVVNSAVVNDHVAAATNSATTAPATTADFTQIAAQLQTLVNSPAVLKAAPQLKPILEQLNHLQADLGSHAVVTGTAGVQSVLDVLPNIGAMQPVITALSPVLASVVPGFGGSLLAVGLGIAVRLFSNRIIDARTADHQTAANTGR